MHNTHEKMPTGGGSNPPAGRYTGLLIVQEPLRTWRLESTPVAPVTAKVRNKIASLNMAYAKARRA